MSDYDNWLVTFDPAGSSVEDDFRPYGLVTIFQNRFGHLEMWQGKRTNFPADVYVQVDTDIEAIIECLPDSERDELDHYGAEIETYFISDEYFPEKGKVDKIIIQNGVCTAIVGDESINIYAPIGKTFSIISDNVTALNGGMILPKADDYLSCGVTHFQGKVAGILVRNEKLYLVEMVVNHGI